MRSVDSWSEHSVEEISLAVAEQRMLAKIEGEIIASVEADPDKIRYPRYAAFCLIEDVQGELYMAARNTPPHVGIYSVVGGKVDATDKAQDPTSSVSTYLRQDGLETPTHAVRRELVEEVFKDTVQELAVATEGREDSAIEDLFPLANFKRELIVYDEVHNSYCFLYVMRTKVGVERMSLSRRELQDCKSLTAIVFGGRPINPLTHLLLQKLGRLPKDYAPAKSYQYGPITKFVRASEASAFPFRRCSMPDAKIIGEKSLREPAFLLVY